MLNKTKNTVSNDFVQKYLYYFAYVKRHLYFLITFIFTFFIKLTCLAQGYYPDIFSNYADFSPTYNSAAIKDTNTFQLNIKHKSQNSNIYKTGLQAQYKLKDQQVKHWLGTYLDNKREGPYIQSPKAFLYYTLVVPLSSQVQLSSSAMLGVSSIAANLPDQSYNYKLPDGSVSLCLLTRTLSIGFSSYQLFDNQFQGFRLKRYYTAFASKTFEISSDFSLELNVLDRIFIDMKDDIRVLGALNWREQFKMGGGINAYQGLYVFIEPSIKLDNHQINISIGYNTQYGNNYQFLANTTEIGIKWNR